MAKKLRDITVEEFIKVNEFVAHTSPMRSHYNSSNPLERWVWRQKKRKIQAFLEEIKIRSIVDLGCGDGGLIEIIDSTIFYTGIDISPTQLSFTKNYIKTIGRKNAVVKEGDVTVLDFSDSEFDAALACDIVEHVLSPEKLFKEIKRIVKKDGYIIFGIPNEVMWEVARALTLKFPLRSPDHIHAIFTDDIKRNFPMVLKEVALPFPLLKGLSLINVFLVKNVK